MIRARRRHLFVDYSVVAAPFHIGIVVRDLEQAMEELTQAAGVAWSEPMAREMGEWSFRLVYSVDGPPHIELVEGPPGSPWDASDGPRLDHAGWWADDVAGEQARLEAAGIALDTQLPIPTAVYMRGPATGLRLELNASVSRPGLYEHLGRQPPAD